MNIKQMEEVEHDNLNALTMGAQIIGAWLARDIIKAYVEAEFSPHEDFRRRVRKFHDLELEAARELQAELERTPSARLT